MNILEQLQSDVTFFLEGDERFAYIPVRSVRKLQITSEIAAKLPHLTTKNSKLGCGVLVGMPIILDDTPNLPGGLQKVRLGLRVHENPTINLSASGSQLSAETVALNALQVLRALEIEGLGSLHPAEVSVQPDTSFEGLVTYEVFMEASLVSSALERVLLPTISESALTVTLTNQTSGATIYYTTDGTLPGSANTAAQTYSVPFLVTSGTTLRWAATKSGLVGSNIGQALIA